MIRFLTGAILAVIPMTVARADDANAVVERAVKAMGGRERLEKIHAAEVKTKGTLFVNGTESQISAHAIGQGKDHYRVEFEADLAGNKVHGMTVVNGNKGWRKFNDQLTEFDDRALKAEKRLIYLQLAGSNPTLLTRQGFKVVKAAEGAVTATGPDGKEFTLQFDKQTGLPAKLTAAVTTVNGEDIKQETIYSDFKDFAGVKRATKVESKRDGEPYLKQELLELKWLDKVDPKTFDEPK